jgi:benzoyl-CoA reductase subunit C
MVLPVEEHTVLVRDYLAAAEKVQARQARQRRVVINGSFCEQPPLALIKSIEMPAATSSMTTSCSCIAGCSTTVLRPDGDPLQNCRSPSCTVDRHRRQVRRQRARRRACTC